MLAANPNSSFHIPLSQLNVSSSKKLKFLSNISPFKWFPYPRNFHLSPNAVPRIPRTRKRRPRSCGSSRNLCRKSVVGASLAAEPDIQSDDALPHPSAPYSIKIPFGDRHVSLYKIITFFEKL